MDYDLFDDFAEEGDNPDECPGCGAVPYVDGVTEGCNDAMGCGQHIREDVDLDEDEMLEDEEDEDESLDELDFD